MKHLLILLLTTLGITSTFWSQQFWEHEFNSTEEKLYKDVLTTQKIKRIKTFFDTTSIPLKVFELDKNGNVLTVIKKANQFSKKKTDVIVEKNSYDKRGNLTSSLKLNSNSEDTSEFVLYQYDSLNNLISEIIIKQDFIKDENNDWKSFYKNITYYYLNKYDQTNKLVHQIKKNNSRTLFRSEFIYDKDGNLIEIKKYLGNSQCLNRWIKFSYYENNCLKDKYYPSFHCQSSSTVNDNLYTYKYNTKKQLKAIEHTNAGTDRGKVVYTYNSANLLTYIQPNSDFGRINISLKYEFYK